MSNAGPLPRPQRPYRRKRPLGSASRAAIASFEGILIVPKRLRPRRAFAGAALYDLAGDERVKGAAAHFIAADLGDDTHLFDGGGGSRLGRSLSLGRPLNCFFARDRGGGATRSRNIDHLDHLAGL